MIVDAGASPGGLLFRRGDAEANAGGAAAAFLSVVTGEGAAEMPSFGAVIALPDGLAPETPTAQDGADAASESDVPVPTGLPPGAAAAAPTPVARLAAGPVAIVAVAFRDDRGASVQTAKVDRPSADDPPAAPVATTADAEEATPSVIALAGATERVPLRAATGSRGNAPDAALERGEIPATPSPGPRTMVRPVVGPEETASARVLPEALAGAARAVEAEDAGVAITRDPADQGARAPETATEKAVTAGPVEVAVSPASVGKTADFIPPGAIDAAAEGSVAERAATDAVREAGPSRIPAAGLPATARLVPPPAFVTMATAPQAAPSRAEDAASASAENAPTAARPDPREIPGLSAGAGGTTAPVGAASAAVPTEPPPQQQAQSAPQAQVQAQPMPSWQPAPVPPARLERESLVASPDVTQALETRESKLSSTVERRSAVPEAAARGPAVLPEVTERPSVGPNDIDFALPLAAADVATRPAVETGAASPAVPLGTGADQTARSVAQQFVAAVLSSGEGGFEIQLSPEELGRVTLSLQVTEDAVVLSIQAERQDTLDLMRRNTDILLREFRDAGFASLSFAFGQGSADGRPARAPAYAGTLEDRVAAAAAPPAAVAGRAASSTRLDLRL